MARPVQADAEATRKNILAAASALFSDKGLAPTTTREIARAAGVSLATVHHYYGGKNDLYRACVDSMYADLDGLRAEIETSLLEARDRGAPMGELVETAVRRVWQFARRHRPAVQLMVRTVLDTGEMEVDKRERYLLPFLDQGTAFLAPLLGRPAFQVRCALLALNYMMTRFTLSSAAELAIALDMPGAPDDQVLGAIEDYLARRARVELHRRRPAMNLPAAIPAPDPSVRTFGPARHRRVAGLHVLSLQGSVYEMGRQHGALLADDVRSGPVPYYRTYIDRIMRTAGLGPLAPLAGRLIRRTVGRQVARAMPPFARDAIRGLADGSGMSYEELLDGCTMPDSLLWVVARMMQLRGVAPAVTHRLALGFGCTSALAWGEGTADGRLLHARNFDYHGVDTWPRTAAVAFHDPDDGQRYVSVTAAGILMGGVTAMNQAGLTITVHQHMFSDGTRLTRGATPIGLVGDLIMRHARDLDQAQAILERHRSIGAWTYLIGDARGEVLCFEENPERQAARRLREEGTFGYANIYIDPELGESERDLYGSYWRANLGRQQRADELLAAGAGTHDPSSMARILADTGGDGCRLRRPIAMLMTVASVVFRPEDGVLWVATGGAPTSHNAFEPFALDSRDHAPEHGALTAGIPDAESAAGFAAYRQSYVAYFDRDDLAGARRAIDAAIEARPDEPLYRVTAGMLALQAGDSAAAMNQLGRALALGHPDPQRIAAAHLWHGRAADLAGRRDQARRDYRTALGLQADPPVVKAARRGLRRPYRNRDAERMAIDHAYADVVNP